MSWRPDGYPMISPYLVVEGAEREIDFMKEALGGSELRRYDAPDGSIVHAEVRIGDSVVMIGDAGGEWEPVPCFLHLYVDDVDATYARALEAGAKSVGEPVHREGDPDRRGGVKSPGGITWWLSTQVDASGGTEA